MNSDDNVYQPPQTALSARNGGDLTEARSANGSFLKVGPRRRFTGRWILPQFSLCMLGLLVHLAVLGLVATFMAFVWPASIVLGLLGGVTGFCLTAYPLLSWYGGTAHGALLFPRASLRQTTEFVVQLTFQPRLPLYGLEGIDSSDDIGALSTEAELLRYRGDRVEMTISREDVDSIRRVRTVDGGVGMTGREVQLDFRAPFLAHRRIRVGIREGFPTLRARKRNRQMCEAIQKWFEIDSARRDAA